MDRIALVSLPSAEVAPAYRESLELRSHFSVDDFGDGIAAVAPAEGAGAVADYLTLVKLCDARSDLSSHEIWKPLRDHPARRRSDVDADEYRAEMLRRGRQIVERNQSAQAEITAFALAAFAAAQEDRLPELLRHNLPPLFEQFPDGSLWLVAIKDVLLARLAFGRAQLAFQLTPDTASQKGDIWLDGFEGLTLTRGIDLSPLVSLPLLVISPSALGFLVPVLPHVLVFCFGDAGADLRRPYPVSLASLYRPGVLGDPRGLVPTLAANPESDDGPELLAWWVDRVNELYSHATDPTRFTDEAGYHDAAAQTAWMITLERLLGDAISLLAEPQATDLHRVQIAFDLLDKAEGLLGYPRNRSGKGFAALLRRTDSAPVIRQALSSLPGSLGGRIADEVDRHFEALYSAARANTVGRRLTPSGTMVATNDARTLEAFADDHYVAALYRAIRNSSHGLLDMLGSHKDRFLLATNTCAVPAAFPALAPLIALGLLADPPALIDGTWRRELAGTN